MCCTKTYIPILQPFRRVHWIKLFLPNCQWKPFLTPIPSASNAPGKSCIKSLGLTDEDKSILETGVWLSDAHVHSTNLLLRKHYPNLNGLQSTLQLQCKLKWDSDPDARSSTSVGSTGSVRPIYELSSRCSGCI